MPSDKPLRSLSGSVYGTNLVSAEVTGLSYDVEDGEVKDVLFTSLELWYGGEPMLRVGLGEAEPGIVRDWIVGRIEAHEGLA